MNHLAIFDVPHCNHHRNIHFEKLDKSFDYKLPIQLLIKDTYRSMTWRGRFNLNLRPKISTLVGIFTPISIQKNEIYHISYIIDIYPVLDRRSFRVTLELFSGRINQLKNH